MAIKYVPTTKDLSTEADKPTEVILSDSDFMFYTMMKGLIEELNRTSTRGK